MEVKEPNAKYLVKPALKQTEVGVIPEDWETTTVGEITAKVGSGKTPSGGSTRYRDTGRPFARSQNIGWGQLLLDDLVFIDDETHLEFSATEIQAGDVLLNITGASIGRSAVADERLAGGNVNQHVCIIRTAKVNSQLVNYILLSSLGQRQIDSFQAGGNREGLNFGQVRSINLALPSLLTEQQAIAEALSDADALIGSLDQLLAKKRQIKQGAMQELLTGQKRLPGFSGEWVEKAMGELFEFSGGLSASRDQLGTMGHCYLHYGDIHTSDKTYVDLSAESQELPRLDVPLKQVSNGSLLRDGDVVFVDASEDEEGTSKHVVVTNPDNLPFISGLHTIVARSKDHELANLYKRFCFQTQAVKSQFRFFAVGTKVSGVSKSNIGKITVMVPPEDEQTAIATVLSDLDAEITALEARLAKARLLKQGMMQELLTGRIRLV